MTHDEKLRALDIVYRANLKSEIEHLKMALKDADYRCEFWRRQGLAINEQLNAAARKLKED
jgi:hypothetical protein